jgi:hypothetical protein
VEGGICIQLEKGIQNLDTLIANSKELQNENSISITIDRSI